MVAHVNNRCIFSSASSMYKIRENNSKKYVCTKKEFDVPQYNACSLTRLCIAHLIDIEYINYFYGHIEL